MSGEDLTDEGVAFNWAKLLKGQRLTWEGRLDRTAITLGTDPPRGKGQRTATASMSATSVAWDFSAT